MIRLVVGLVTLAVGLGIHENPGAVGFRVKRIRMEGTRLLTDETLAPIIGGFVGRPMNVRTCNALSAALRGHWAVERVEACRVWPSTIRVRISEVPIVARIAHPDPAAIDRTGRVIATASVPDTLPILQGWTPGEDWMPVLGALERLMASPGIWEGSTVMGPPADGWVALECPRLDVSIMLPCPPDDYLPQRLSFAATVLADMRARGEHPDALDLRWSNQIVARREPG